MDEETNVIFCRRVGGRIAVYIKGHNRFVQLVFRIGTIKQEPISGKHLFSQGFFEYGSYFGVSEMKIIHDYMYKLDVISKC